MSATEGKSKRRALTNLQEAPHLPQAKLSAHQEVAIEAEFHAAAFVQSLECGTMDTAQRLLDERNAIVTAVTYCYVKNVQQF